MFTKQAKSYVSKYEKDEEEMLEEEEEEFPLDFVERVPGCKGLSYAGIFSKEERNEKEDEQKRVSYKILPSLSQLIFGEIPEPVVMYNKKGELLTDQEMDNRLKCYTKNPRTR